MHSPSSQHSLLLLEEKKIQHQLMMINSDYEDDDSSSVSSASTCDEPYQSQRSQLFDCTWSDLHILKSIGNGSFAMVLKATTTCDKYSDKNTPSVAVKCLKEGDLDSRTRDIAMNDLREEARILTTLNHPNIVKIRGVASPGHRFFFVMDLLHENETLETKLRQWARLQRKEQQQEQQRNSRCGLSLRWPRRRRLLRTNNKKTSSSSRSLSPIIGSSSSNAVPTLHDRLFHIAFKLSKALNYLHQRRIVHCDLKPANIGFDRQTGAVQLFDFGLSRDLSRMSDNGDEEGDCISGSYRYMAPEIMEGKPIELSADIYSFSILLWELVTLERPHQKQQDQQQHPQTIANLTDLVVNQQGRPSLEPIPLPSLCQLLEESWQPEPSNRLSSEKLVKGLMNVVKDASKNEDDNDDDKGKSVKLKLPNSSSSRFGATRSWRQCMFWGGRIKTMSNVTDTESPEMEEGF